MATEALAESRPVVTAAKGRPFRRPWGAIALFLGPVIVYYLIFVIYPLLATFYYAFHTIAPAKGKLVTTFVGLENFKHLSRDDIFIRAVKNTLTWGVVGPTIEMVTATTLAFIVYLKVPLYRFYRVAWFTPILVSGVIVGLVFRWIFNYDWGLLNAVLRAIGLDVLALNWLGRRDTPLWVVIFVHYWATFGYSFVLLLAGLTAIPDEIIEAAYIDGATIIQAVTRVMLPLLRPTFVTVLILSFMGKMRAFNVVWVLTNGGPMHFSETVATYVQKRAFGWGSLDLGYPSAMAVVWFGVVIIGVSLINRWLKRQVEY
ncbi:MAG TPA: sugar ABC transporter permease [Caldilineae bacterium]|jgi:multiple sugar transport system permease protein/raffinose/stachyose/melibiose transport system permease protein|nr:sugar ABC transporter permease [Caldilineae bacterium]